MVILECKLAKDNNHSAREFDSYYLTALEPIITRPNSHADLHKIYPTSNKKNSLSKITSNC